VGQSTREGAWMGQGGWCPPPSRPRNAGRAISGTGLLCPYVRYEHSRPGPDLIPPCAPRPGRRRTPPSWPSAGACASRLVASERVL